MMKIVGVVAAVAVAVDAACPYASLAASQVVISDKTVCPAVNATCVVDKTTCSVLPWGSYWDAIGTFKDAPPQFYSWFFTGGRSVINLNMATFPDRFSELSFTNISMPADSNLPPWPTNLTKLTMQNGNLKKISVLYPLPSKLSILFLGANYLSSVDDLRTLPRSITRLSLQNNDYTELSNLDWSKMTLVYLINCNLLRSINMVKFSTSIVHLDLSSVTLTKWIMDNSTFIALNSTLRPNNTADDSSRDDDTKNYIGYGYYNTKITTSGADCAAANGVIQELWPDKSMRYYKYASEVFKVCVVKDLATVAPAPTTTPAPEDSSSQTGLIVGIIAGAVVLLGIGAFCFVKRRKNAHRDDDRMDGYRQPSSHGGPRKAEAYQDHYHQADGGGDKFSADRRSVTQNATSQNSGNNRYSNSGGHSTPSLSSTDESNINLTALALVRVDAREVMLHQKLGSGAFADVWRGSFLGQDVAVKVLHPSRVTFSQIQSFVSEIQLMSTFDSPFVVKLVGACWTRPSDLQCVMELMDGGDLKDYLDAHSPAEFAWVDKYKHIYQIVEGMVYLHSLNIIHRDIKSRNILLDSTKGTKLTDFGVSKEDIQATMTMGVGTFRWMAPEVLQDQGYTISADVYSFGMILSEFDTHHVPYVDMVNPINGQPLVDSAIILKVVSGQIKPTFTDECPRWIYEMAQQCLAHDPDQRPTAMQLSFIIGNRLKDLTKQRPMV